MTLYSLFFLVITCQKHYNSCTYQHSFLQTDQFIACGKPREKAHELASHIWLAVINNLEENESTFVLLKRLAQEGDVSIEIITSSTSATNSSVTVNGKITMPKFWVFNLAIYLSKPFKKWNNWE